MNLLCLGEHFLRTGSEGRSPGKSFGDETGALMLVADHLEPCTADAQHGEPRSAQSQPDPHHLNVRSIGMRTRISVRPLLRPRRNPIPVRFRCVKRQECFLPPKIGVFFSEGPRERTSMLSLRLRAAAVLPRVARPAARAYHQVYHICRPYRCSASRLPGLRSLSTVCTRV